jgi:hypothetical protein
MKKWGDRDQIPIQQHTVVEPMLLGKYQHRLFKTIALEDGFKFRWTKVNERVPTTAKGDY